MKASEKIFQLKDNHLSEWLTARQAAEAELSQNQKVFCVCGRLATGFHERNCRKFHQLVEKETLKKTEHLLKK